MNFAHIWMICFLFNFKLRWFLSCWSFILNFFFIKFKWQFSRVHKLAREWDRNFTWKIELKLTYGGATVKFLRNFYGLIDYFEGKTNDHFDLIYMRLRIYPNRSGRTIKTQWKVYLLMNHILCIESYTKGKELPIAHPTLFCVEKGSSVISKILKIKKNKFRFQNFQSSKFSHFLMYP